MIDNIKDWFADYTEAILGVAFALIVVVVIVLVVVHESASEQNCHDAGGHWVKSKSSHECWVGHKIHP
jgi:hypothetical protein